MRGATDADAVENWGPADIDVVALTAVLREWGTLPVGAVASASACDTAAFNSRTIRLRVTYDAAAPAGTPTALVVKRNSAAEWSIEAGADEVSFYRTLAALPDHPPVVLPCLGARYDPDTRDSMIVLPDLTGGYAPPVTRDQQIAMTDGVPPEPMIEAVVDALADLHAYWWQPGDPVRAGVSDRWREDWRFEAYLAHRTESWRRFRAAEEIPDGYAERIDHLLAALPDYWHRAIAPRLDRREHVTLTHGDTYFANFLCRVEGGAPAYLIDWQSPSVDVAGYDLVNLCATFWSREQRRAGDREHRILRRYHEAITARGVGGYGYDDLLRDYRHALLYWLLVPIQDAVDGSPRDYWWPKLRCLVDAYDDHDCAAHLTA